MPDQSNAELIICKEAVGLRLKVSIMGLISDNNEAESSFEFTGR